jgi:hypothetical protein
MALNRKPVLWAGLALVAVIVAALRTAGDPQPDPSELRVQRVRELRQRLSIARSRWSAMEERDSSGALGAARAGSDAPPILFRGFGAGAQSPIAEQAVSEAWGSLGSQHPAARSAVIIYDGETYKAPFFSGGGWYFSGARITRSDSGTTCVAILPGWLAKNGSVSVGKQRLEEVLAPCVMLSAFGAPGPAVSPWLEANRYLTAGSNAWLNRSRSFIDGRGAPPWASDYRGWDDSRGESGSLLLSNPITRSVAEMMAPPYELGVPGLRCIAGQVAACRANALDTMWVANGTRDMPRDLTFGDGLFDWSRATDITAPHPPVQFWISDLIRDQGREKFAKFWKSGGTFEQAFHDAFGEDLGVWTMRWAVRQWENSWWEKYRHQPRLLGVTLEPSWSLVVLGWTGVVLIAAAWTARKRRVT